MLKSVRNQLILSSFVSLLFIIYTYLNFNYSTRISDLIANIFIFITLASVFNTGLLTQKYLHSKNVALKDAKNPKSFTHS